MPSGVALTTTSAAPTAASSPANPMAVAPGASAAARAPASARRAATVTVAPARPSATTMARAAPPAPRTRTRCSGGIDAVLAQCRDQAVTVGGVAQDPAVAVDHRVHRAQRGRGRRQLVAGLGDVGLVRHGDAQPRDAEGPHRRHGVAAASRGDRERHVHPVQAERGERRVVDRGRAGVGDRVADHPHDARRAARGSGSGFHGADYSRRPWCDWRPLHRTRHNKPLAARRRRWRCARPGWWRTCASRWRRR